MQPRGQLSNSMVTADIITNDQISRAEDYRPLIVGYHNGHAVRLSDVADVDGLDAEHPHCRLHGRNQVGRP